MNYNHWLDILAEFGGGRGPAANLAVRFLLAAFFWGVLALTASMQWRAERNRRDLYVSVAASVGLARELFMFVAEYLATQGLLSHETTFRYYPPIEHALNQINYIIHGAAFFHYFIGPSTFLLWYAGCGLASVLLVFALVLPSWQQFLAAHPHTTFGFYPFDIYLHVYMSLLVGIILVVLARAKTRTGKRIRFALLAGFSLFFLDDFLMIFSLAEGEVHRDIYAPIRHNLHIWAIPWFIFVYWQNLLDQATAMRRAAEEERARSDAVLGSLGDGVSIQDLRYRIQYQNERHREMLGDHVGAYCYESSLGENAVCGSCPLEQTFLDGQVHVAERYHEAGNRFFVITTSPLRDAQGNIVAGIEVVHDQTEQRMLTERFHEAQRIEAIGRLAGGVAHDFNNLLTAMFVQCSILDRQDGLPPAAHDEVKEIKKIAERAADLTRQLLSYSRRKDAGFMLVDLNAAISSIAKMLKRLVSEDVELVIDLAPSLGPVKADPSQIAQVLMNLVVNARDAMAAGGGRLVISTAVVQKATVAATEHGGREVLLSVSDTGCGMDEALKKRIFDPFFTTKKSGMGTGLGLSSVREIITQMGGRIEVESETGRGATLRIFLPEEEGQPFRPAEDASIFCPAPRAATVLVVEDEERVRGVLRRVLAESGYQVLVAGDGIEALRVSAEHREAIDVLLTDVVMPYMSGKQLAAELYRQRPGMRVVFMSGYPEDILELHGVMAAESDLIAKPFAPETVLARLNEVLRRPLGTEDTRCISAES